MLSEFLAPYGTSLAELTIARVVTSTDCLKLLLVRVLARTRYLPVFVDIRSKSDCDFISGSWCPAASQRVLAPALSVLSPLSS
jgi:hypothetical protein